MSSDPIEDLLRCCHDFSSEFENVLAQHQTGKILSFDFYPKAVYTLNVGFVFHSLPFLTFKTDQGKVTSFTH